MNKAFMAFENESDFFEFGGITVENRLDRISVYGSLDITKDRLGLEHALKLKRIIDSSIEALKRDKNLPDIIGVQEGESVINPFKRIT